MQAGYRMDLNKRARDLKLRRRNAKIDKAVYGSDFKDKDIDTSIIKPTGKTVENSTQTDRGIDASAQTVVFSEPISVQTDTSFPPNENITVQQEPVRATMRFMNTVPSLSVQTEPYPDANTPLTITPRSIQSLPTTPPSIFIPSSTATQIINPEVRNTVNRTELVDKITTQLLDTELEDAVKSLIREFDKPNRDIVSETTTELPMNESADMKTQLESVSVKKGFDEDEETKDEEQTAGEPIISPEEERPLINEVVDEYNKATNEDKSVIELIDKLEERAKIPFTFDEMKTNYKESAIIASSFLNELKHITMVYNDRLLQLPQSMRDEQEFKELKIPKSKKITLYTIDRVPTSHRLNLKYQTDGKIGIYLNDTYSMNPTAKRRKALVNYDIKKYDLLYSLAKAKQKLYSNDFDLTYEGNPNKRVGQITGFGIEGTEKPVHWSNKDEDVDNSVSLPHFKNGTFVFNPLGKPHKPLQLRNPSKAFMDIVKDIVDRDTFNATDYKKIKAAHEQKILLKFMKVANPIVPKGIKIDEINVGDLQLLRKRYQVLLGELVAGNQGEAVKSEMIKILQTLKKTRNMNPAKVDDLIQGLNEL